MTKNKEDKDKKCKKTLLGKHFWEEVVKNFTTTKDGLAPDVYYKKCRACGMIDSKLRSYRR